MPIMSDMGFLDQNHHLVALSYHKFLMLRTERKLEMANMFKMATLIASVGIAGSAFAINGSVDTQVKGTTPGYQVTEIFSIGESFGGYTPVGILDGLGAYDLGNGTVRVYANHELNSGVGHAYTLASGASLTGARVSYFDIDQNSRQLIGTGAAYDTIINASGSPVTSAADVAALGDGGGIARLCSAMFVKAGTYGFVDNIFLTGEEASGANGGKGGYEYALDAANNTLYAAPALGFAAWESVTPIDTGVSNKTALLVGDDREGAPAYLWVGDKNAGTGGFLDRNGLENGQLYAWKADSGAMNPLSFNGTGSTATGSWVQINNLTSIADQDAEALGKGAFEFSRPEDVHTDPNDGTRAVFTSTGRQNWLGGADVWGTSYVFDIDFDANGNPTAGNVEIIVDGNDGNAGQFADPADGLRSPDNLTWADDGNIYFQEDRAISGALFGATGEETSIWKWDATSGQLERVFQVDRSAVLPDTQIDTDPGDLGDWETSGIIDVSALFGEAPGTLFIADVQAHSVRDGAPGNLLENYVNADGDRNTSLVEGGQLVFLSVPEPTSLALLAIGGLMVARRRRA